MRFLNFFRRNVLLSTDCRLFTAVISIVVVACSLVFTYILYSSHIKEKHEKLILAANTIDIVLGDSFKEIRNLMTYIGKEISIHEKEQLNFIASILSNSYDMLSKNRGVLSCPQFGWANSQHLIVIGDKCEVRPQINKKPIDVSHRPYVSICQRHPWTFHISRPVIGATSGLWIIPAVFGVTTPQGRYLGSLITGIEIFKLSHRIQQILNSTDISFLILDEDLRIIVQSLNNSIDPKSSYYRDLLEKYDFFNLRDSTLKDPIKYKDIEYSFYKKMSDYPYVILTGFETNFTYKNFLIGAGFQLLELWGIGLFCLALLYFFRKRLLSIAYICEKDRELFLKQIQQETQKPIASILKHCAVLLEYFKGEAHNPSAYQQLELVGSICEAASNLHSLTTISNLNFSFFDVNQSIKECLNIHRHTVVVKEISVRTEFYQNLAPLYADELRFKQMMLGLIALAIDTYIPQGGIIKVSTLLDTIEGKKHLVITVEDNGLGFDAEDIKRMKSKFSTNNTHFTGMDLSSIEQLVSMHQGIFRLDATLPHGKKFTIALPYREEKPIEYSSAKVETVNSLGSNVYIFPGSTNK